MISEHRGHLAGVMVGPPEGHRYPENAVSGAYEQRWAYVRPEAVFAEPEVFAQRRASGDRRPGMGSMLGQLEPVHPHTGSVVAPL